ncbi:MAG: DUF1799 domain-containing protein [Betaproteobacteria bacterium]|nr:DUF1799 domain-containing protein [Betaproteobacteria bacterium]
MSEDQAERWLGLDEEDDAEPEPFEIWPENMPTLKLFLFCESDIDLIVTGMGGLLYKGLSTVNILANAQALGVSVNESMIADLKAMAAVVCGHRNQQVRAHG